MGKIKTSNAAGIGSYVIVINKDDMKIKGDQSEIKKKIRGSIDNAEQIYVGVQKNGSFEKLESANVDITDGELKLITESYILNFEAEEIEIEDNPGGGGGGGTSDYSKLTNKPTIDGVELRKGATHSELGLLGTADKEDLENSIAGKQDRLTAGENITINGTVISATGGGGSIEPGDKNGTVLTTVVNYAENPAITPHEMAASNTLYINLAALVAERPDWTYFQLVRNQSGMPWDLYTQDIEYDTNKQSKSIIWSSGIDMDQSLFFMKQHYLDPELGDTVKEYRLYTNLSDYPQDYNEEYQTWPGFPEQLPVGKTLLATHVKGETDEMLFSDLYDNTEIICLSMSSFTNDSGQEITIPEIWNELTHHVSTSPIALPEKTVEWKYPEAHIQEVFDFGNFENESGIFTGDSFAQASTEDDSTCVNILSSGKFTPSDGSSDFKAGTAQIMVESFLNEEEEIFPRVTLSVSGNYNTDLYVDRFGARLSMDTYPSREKGDSTLLVTKGYVDDCVPSIAPEGESILVNHRQNAIKHLKASYTEEEFVNFLDGEEMKNVRCWYMEGDDSKFVGFGVSDLAGVHGFLYQCVNEATDEDTTYAYLPVDMGPFTPGWYLVHDLYNYDVEPIDYVPDFYCPTGGDDVNFEFEGVDSVEEFDVLLDVEQYFEQWTEWEPKEEKIPTTITFKANAWSWPTDVDSKMIYDHTKKALQEYQQSGSTLNLSLPIYRVFDDSSMTFDNEYSVSVGYIDFQEGEEAPEDPQIRFAFYRGEDEVASRYLLSDGNFTEPV